MIDSTKFDMKKNILMIAFHYPPVGASSGVHRTFKFSQYLLQYDWNPLILTVPPYVFECISDAQIKNIPEELVVKRAFALDTSKHLTIKGSYIGWMALPDRWISWWLPAILKGLLMVRKYKPKVIWSTYPIATAHLIGYTLHKLTRLPWVADFRDSMTEPDYPPDPKKRRIFRWIEKKTIENCKFAVFTTPSAVEMYRARYPEIDANKFVEIANGYDEEAFMKVEGFLEKDNTEERPFVLVHSGLLYPSERDPRQFFNAIKELKNEQKVNSESLQIILRASGHDSYYQAILNELAISDIIKLEGSLPYDKALKEMLQADALLLFQASSCNHQIPAKVYEYIRARKPMLAMTDRGGDTAKLLSGAGISSIVPLDSKEEIKQELLTLIHNSTTEVNLPSDKVVASFSRKSRTVELVRLLDRISL